LTCGHWLNRFGYRTLAATGAVLMILGFLYQITLDMHASLLQVSSVCLAAGYGMGLATTAITVSVQNNVAPQELGVATASTIFSRALGAAVGVSLLGAVLSQRVAHELRNTFPEANAQAMTELRALLLPESRAHITRELAGQLQNGLAAGLHTIFLACTAVAVLALIVTLRVSSRKPAKEAVGLMVESGA
jgi:MFS family permease